jgi:hypothetical protein
MLQQEHPSAARRPGKTALTPLAKHSFRRILEQEDASAEQPSLQKQSSYIEQDASAKRLFGKTTLLQEDL